MKKTLSIILVIIFIFFNHNRNMSAENDIKEQPLSKVKNYQFIDKDIKEFEELLNPFINECLSNNMIKATNDKYYHEDFFSPSSDSVRFYIVDKKYKIVDTKIINKNEMKISVKFNQIVEVDIFNCDTTKKTLILDYFLKKQNNKWLLFDIPLEHIYYIEPAIEMTKKRINRIGKGKDQAEGYKYIYDCLKNTLESMNKNKY